MSDEPPAGSLPVPEEADPAEEKSGDGELDGEEDDGDDLQCGFLVDKINTAPYQKALSRGEVPFCAFAPISTQELYLLRIQDCSDTTRHMLVPASKDDVFSTPGALKAFGEEENGGDPAMNYRVAIVAIARQIYSEEDKQLVVSVDAPSKQDREKIKMVKFLSLDKFADFAFLGFDGDVSEFTKADETKECDPTTTTEGKPDIPADNSVSKDPLSPSLPPKEKTPPRPTARRGGRGGRKRASRRSPPMPSPQRANQFHQHLQHLEPPGQQLAFQMLRPYPHPSEMMNDYSHLFLKSEPGDNQCQFLTEVPMHMAHHMPDHFHYGQAINTIPMPPPVEIPVPMPASEVTVSTSEPGAEACDQQANYDIITIALDQLFPMTSGDGSSSSTFGQPEKGSRGGRRPGRKPGRKPNKEREQGQVVDESTSAGHRIQLNSDGSVPKRRGRPPKNRLILPTLCDGQEHENPQMDTEDETLMLAKRLKLQIINE